MNEKSIGCVSKNTTDIMIVMVECSANNCVFKDNDGYYGICRNPRLQVEYQMLAGGGVKLSGCDCSSCSSDCVYKNNMLDIG